MKNEFEFLHYHIRWIFSIPCLIIALIFNRLLDRMGLNTFVYLLLTIVFTVLILRLYYTCASRLRGFEDTGAYNVDNGILKITMGKRIYEISNITELMGNVKTVFGAKFATLYITDNSGSRLSIFSSSLGDSEVFENSSVYPIYKLILDREQGLEPKMILGMPAEHWYLKK